MLIMGSGVMRRLLPGWELRRDVDDRHGAFAAVRKRKGDADVVVGQEVVQSPGSKSQAFPRYFTHRAVPLLLSSARKKPLHKRPVEASVVSHQKFGLFHQSAYASLVEALAAHIGITDAVNSGRPRRNRPSRITQGDVFVNDA